MPKWATDEINLLGTMTDSALAQRIGRSRKAVEHMRLSLEIPAFTPHQRKWSKREVAMLGVLPDGVIAKKLKISRQPEVKELQAAARLELDGLIGQDEASQMIALAADGQIMRI